MMKPLLSAAFAIALTSAGAFAAYGHSSGSSPAVVPSVSVAPLSLSQASQAKLSPLDTGLLDTSIETLPLTTNEFTPADSLSAHVGAQLSSDAPDQLESFASQATIAPSSSSIASSTTAGSVAPAMTMGTNGPSNISVVTNPNPGANAASQALSSFNAAQPKLAALDVPAVVKTQIFQLFQVLQSQLLATTLSTNTTQNAAASNSITTAVNTFLKNVNGLNASAGDKAKAFAVLLPTFASVPGVNLNYSTVAAPLTTQLAANQNGSEFATEMQTQIKAITAQAQANMDAQRKYITLLPTESAGGVNTQDFLNAALNPMYYTWPR